MVIAKMKPVTLYRIAIAITLCTFIVTRNGPIAMIVLSIGTLIVLLNELSSES